MGKNTHNGLRVVALFDGRPGHEKQTWGIIQALKKITTVQVVALPVVPRGFISTLMNTCRLFLPGSGVSHPDVKGNDILIGTGTHTHIPLLLYKKRYGSPVITCMSPASYLRSFFDICFVPAHDGLLQSNTIFLTMGSPNCSTNYGNHNPQCGLILLGGVDFKSHFWNDTDIVDKIRKVVLRESDIYWTITSSPRTPEGTVSKVKSLVELHENCTFFHYEDTAAGWIEDQYNKNRYVWVTSDSISMIYEALTAGCKVGLFPMQWKKADNKFLQNEILLIEKGLVLSFASWEKNEKISGEKQVINEAQRCAEHIMEKLWSENLR